MQLNSLSVMQGHDFTYMKDCFSANFGSKQRTDIKQMWQATADPHMISEK